MPKPKSEAPDPNKFLGSELPLPKVNDQSVKRPQFTYRKISELNPYKNNPRAHSDADIRMIAHSIAYFGWTNPVQVQKGTNVVIAGHGRIEAAKLLGLTEVPVTVLDHNDQDASASRIADNRLAELSFWDKYLLKAELVDLDAAGFNIAQVGYTDEELKAFLEWERSTFLPTDQADQSRLDQKTPVKCPECGHEFTP